MAIIEEYKVASCDRCGERSTFKDTEEDRYTDTDGKNLPVVPNGWGWTV